MTTYMTTWLFWFSLACILYTFIGYPLLLRFFPKKSLRLDVHKDLFIPNVSIVIAAWNEEANISKRLDNLLTQDYPTDKTEIIVVSDGSTDSTNSIVSSYSDRSVRLVSLEDRLGKAQALNQGIAQAKGNIIVFCDARQYFEPSAVSWLVANFYDPRVGCVSGELILVKDDQSRIQVEMGAYWNYEKWIRKMESRTGSVVGATGSIYAIRRFLFKPLPPGTILDDVLTPLNIVREGYRCIFESKAVALDCFSKDTGQEWQRKVRTLAGNWQMLSLQPELLLPWRNPCWWRLVSHKILRLIVPFALIILFISGALLQGMLYRTVVVLQCLLYASALLACLLPTVRANRILRLEYFFLVMNAAALAGFWRWITGDCKTVWQPLGADNTVK